MSPFLSIVRPVANRALPQSVRRLLVRTYFKIGLVLKYSMERRFNRRRTALADFEPLLRQDQFTGGPIFMVNGGLASGGVERQIVTTLRALGSRNDHAFGLLCLKLGAEPDLDFFKPALADFPGTVRNAMSAANAKGMLKKMLSEPSLSRVRQAIAWMPGDVREEILRLTGEFSLLKPSVVHAWQDNSGISAAYAARIVGVPRIIISTRNVRPTNFGWYRPHMYHAHGELACCANVVMVNNSEAGAADYARWLRIPVSRFVVKHNGLDTSTIRRAAPAAVARLRERLDIPADAPVIGSIFRLDEEKRPLFWTQIAGEVARRDPRCHFVIFGTGPLQSAAERTARREGIETRFHCPGTIADAALGLSLFDVFLLTSQFEGTPNVVLEASALGIPVVATEAGGTREAIDEGVTGYLIDRADPALVASRIVNILQAPEWRDRVKTEGPAFVECRFGLDRMIAETLTLYGINPG